MLRTKNRAFTLIELIIVVVLVIILSIIGIASYGKARNKAISKEAVANLKLIAAAERIYKMESNADAYAACLNSGACNTMLKLYLNETNWTHSVATNGLSGPTATATITATGTSSGISGCTYTFQSADFDNTSGYSTKTAGVCP